MLRILGFLIKFPNKSEHLDNKKLVSSAYKEVFIAKDFSEKNFFTTLDNKIADELRKPEDTFYVLTTISLNIRDLKAVKLLISGCEISFKEFSYSESFTGREAVLQELKSEIGDCDDIRGYAKVEIRVKSRNKSEAFDRAINALNIFRAFTAFEMNSRGIIAGNYSKPINKVRLGKVHTLHNDDGVAFEHPAFYEPDFQKAKVEKPQNSALFQKNVSTLLSWLSKCPFSRKLEKALIRFVLALDHSDKNLSVINLWGALESLVADGDPNCDKLPTRLAALHRDFEVAKHIVMHIREYRNEHVHQGIDDDDSIHRSYYLQNMFANVIDYYIRPRNKLSSLQEANLLLDKLVLGKSGLNKELDVLNRALAFMGETPPE
jgi:hypothetical protein